MKPRRESWANFPSTEGDRIRATGTNRLACDCAWTQAQRLTTTGRGAKLWSPVIVDRTTKGTHALDLSLPAHHPTHETAGLGKRRKDGIPLQLYREGWEAPRHREQRPSKCD